MEKSELNISIKDIQALGGLSRSSAQKTLAAAKRATKKGTEDWLSLKDLCEFKKIDYFLALSLFKAK